MRINGRTHHAIVSARGSRWQELDLIMFTVYLDDSGTRPTHKIAVASALIIPAAQITRLESEWETLKRKQGFSFFHASPCNAKGGKQFAGWDDVKVDRVFARVRQICKKYGVAASSASVKKSYFDETIPAEYRKYTLTDHYSWCISWAIADVERWRSEHDRMNPFEFVFDWVDVGSPVRAEIDKLMSYSERAAKELDREGEYKHYIFEDKRDVPGLQCADDIAWICNRFALNAFEGISLPRRAQEGWDWYEGNNGADGWLRAITFSKAQLEKFIAQEMADGRTIERIRRWEEEDREKTK